MISLCVSVVFRLPCAKWSVDTGWLSDRPPPPTDYRRCPSSWYSNLKLNSFDPWRFNGSAVCLFVYGFCLFFVKLTVGSQK